MKKGQNLRWKLTLSYTAVTIGALLSVELLLFGALSILLMVLVNSGFLPAVLIENASIGFVPTLRTFLDQTPPDQIGIKDWLERVSKASSANLPLSFDGTEEMLVVGHDGRLLGSNPVDLVNVEMIGKILDTEFFPGMAAPLQAALSGEDDVERLYTLGGSRGKIVMAVPIWDSGHQRVLGVLVAMAETPTITSVTGDLLPIVGISLLFFTLIAGLAGTAFGFLAARGPVRRLERLAEATIAWSQGDFTLVANDQSGDELGDLARRLNEMARQLEQLLETRRELTVVEERNRIARDLHDSAKQQAFAAAAQISGVRALIKRDPAAAESHIEEAERLIYDLRQELTTLVQELRPAALQGKGLAPALRDLGVDWSRQNGIPLDVRVQGERPLPLESEQSLFRIAQEALANVARHSHATRAEIGLAFDRNEIRLVVKDDGRGFDVERENKGFGLHSVRERVDRLGGTLSVESIAGKGTAVICRVPSGGSRIEDKVDSHG